MDTHERESKAEIIRYVKAHIVDRDAFERCCARKQLMRGDGPMLTEEDILWSFYKGLLPFQQNEILLGMGKEESVKKEARMKRNARPSRRQVFAARAGRFR